MKPIVLWDFDGTLFDSYPATIHAFQVAMSRFNIHEDYETIHKDMMISVNYCLEETNKKYGLGEFLIQAWYEELRHVDLTAILPFPYAKESLAYVKDNGGTNILITHRNHTAIDILKMQNMNDYMEECITQENGFPRKPNPACIKYVLDKYQISPKDCCIVGDRNLEIECGQKAGISTVYVQTSGLAPKLSPTEIIPSLKDFPKIYDSLFSPLPMKEDSLYGGFT